MSDRRLGQLVAETQHLDTKEARREWALGLSDAERETFLEFANGIISNLRAIWNMFFEEED